MINYLDYIFLTISAYPIVIQIAIYFIFINVTFTLFYFIFMLSIRHKQNKRNKIYDIVKNNVLDALNHNTYIDNKNIDIIIECLCDIIYNDKKYLEYDSYKQILNDLHIQEYLLNKLDSIYKKNRLSAIKSLLILRIDVPYSLLLKNINKQVITNYIALTDIDKFRYFSDQKLTEWDIIYIIDLIEKYDIEIPNFINYIKWSNNSNDIIFYLKLISNFKQNENIEDILYLLNNENINIRKQFIQTCGDIKYTNILLDLLKIFSSEKLICQLEIIETINKFNINTQDVINFLKKQFNNSNEYQLKLLILYTLQNINNQEFQLFKTLNSDKTLFNHVEKIKK